MPKYSFEREYNPNFTGREREIKWLDERLFRRNYSFSPTVISGSAGVGKTALVKQWLSSERHRHTPIWLDLDSEININDALEDFVNYLSRVNEEKFPFEKRLIVVIDGSDKWNDKQHSEAASKIFNYKMVSSLIFIRRDSLPLERSEQLAIEPLSNGSTSELLKKLLIYDIGEDGLNDAIKASQGYPLAISLLSQLLRGENLGSVSKLLENPLYELSNNILVPKKEIITVASPIILSANQSLVTTLQKQPSDLHKLTPREFEKLLADLLVDMGWEVELTKQTRDGGSDILAYLNTDIGRLLCLVEAKHYREDRKIGVDLVRTLYGTLCDAQANSAMLVTSSSFTKDAKEFQQKHKYQLTLRDYADVVTWILKFGKKKNTA